MSKQTPIASERRSFLTRFPAGAASLAAVALGGTALGQVKQAAPTRWEPARHDQDNWLDELPGKHRLVFDTTGANSLGSAALFANNYMLVNRTDYGLQNSDLAIVVVLRHQSTAFGFNDAMWAKYGAPIATRSSFEDPKTKGAPKTNLFNARDYGTQLPNWGTTLDALTSQGVQFAICSVATMGVASAISKATGGNANTINDELKANLIGNARMVPAGIVAVSRAQERGYSLVAG
ncbi:MAG: hypothetical protein ABI824_19700 [Acidobacteriota bacterium]